MEICCYYGENSFAFCHEDSSNFLFITKWVKFEITFLHFDFSTPIFFCVQFSYFRCVHFYFHSTTTSRLLVLSSFKNCCHRSKCCRKYFNFFVCVISSKHKFSFSLYTPHYTFCSSSFALNSIYYFFLNWLNTKLLYFILLFFNPSSSFFSLSCDFFLLI
jgi:hypothetical protein